MLSGRYRAPQLHICSVCLYYGYLRALIDQCIVGCWLIFYTNTCDTWVHVPQTWLQLHSPRHLAQLEAWLTALEMWVNPLIKFSLFEKAGSPSRTKGLVTLSVWHACTEKCQVERRDTVCYNRSVSSWLSFSWKALDPLFSGGPGRSLYFSDDRQKCWKCSQTSPSCHITTQMMALFSAPTCFSGSWHMLISPPLWFFSSLLQRSPPYSPDSRLTPFYVNFTTLSFFLSSQGSTQTDVVANKYDFKFIWALFLSAHALAGMRWIHITVLLLSHHQLHIILQPVS